MSPDGLKFFWRHYAGNHRDYMSLGALRWCWLYYFVKAGQGYVPKEGGKCRSGRFPSTRVVKPSHQHRRPLWQCCSSAGNRPESTFSNAKFFDNIYFISDAEFLIAAAAGRNKEMQFHLSETLFSARDGRYRIQIDRHVWNIGRNFKASGWSGVFRPAVESQTS